MKKTFTKYGTLEEIKEARFYGRISELWAFADKAVSLEDNREYNIVYSSALYEYRWMEM